MIFRLARRNLHGPLPLPKSAMAAQALLAGLNHRLASFASRAEALSRSRTSDEKRAAELAVLLEFWLIHGRPQREFKPSSTPS